MEDAIVIATGSYGGPNGKVAHGLVRGGSRFRIRAVVEPAAAGADAGELLDGVRREIPMTASVEEACESAPTATVAIVGVATHGGRITPVVREALLSAARAGLEIISGLHDFAGDDPDIAGEAENRGVAIRDLRRPPPKDALRFWTGDVRSVRAARIAVLGTDCAVGKRTTARLVTSGLEASGLRAEMIYTGQTGWLQGGRFGIILDALPNDYVSGELEGALVTCDRELSPDVMVLEGQSSLRNPSGPCGAELLVSGGATAVILQHAPGRPYFEGYEDQRLEIPPLGEELALIRLYGAEVIGLSLSREGLSERAFDEARADLAARHGIPVACPLRDGIGALVAAARSHLGLDV